MSLEKLESPRIRRDIFVYDMEWYPHSYELRVIGFHDGKRYRAFVGDRPVEDFLNFVLTPRFSGKDFHAHAGGTADFVFLLSWFVKNQDRGFELEVCLANSSAVIVIVRKGQHEWRFCDSFFLLRTSLAKIGESVGVRKGFEEEKGLGKFYKPLPELIEYNEQDCLILHTALSAFQEEMFDLGGEMRATAASTAMALFRRQFLQRTVHTNKGMNMALREAYIASRVEVFKKEILNAYQYDINSSFPASMKLPAPGSFLRFSKRIPPKGCYFAYATVSVPPQDIPPVPYREAGKVWYPYGTWTAWFSGIDIEMILEYGGRIEELRNVALYEDRDDLAAYVDVLYGLRKKATNDFRKDVLKILLNSLYGKFGERSLKHKVHVCPPSYEALMKLKMPDGSPACIEYMPGVILQKEETEIMHEHIPFPAYVTSRSRKLITDGVSWAGDCAYTDTDCIFTERGDMPTSDELGAYKLEGRVAYASFQAPKLYEKRMWLRDKKTKQLVLGPDGLPILDVQVKSKGFSRLTGDDYRILRDGWTIPMDRMTRPRELLRRSKTHEPGGILVPKRLRTFVDKRRFSSDGTSVPYSVDEILAGLPEEVGRNTMPFTEYDDSDGIDPLEDLEGVA